MGRVSIVVILGVSIMKRIYMSPDNRLECPVTRSDFGDRYCGMTNEVIHMIAWWLSSGCDNDEELV